MVEFVMYKMAGYGRFMLFIDSGNLLCARNNLLNFYQSASRNALKYLHDSAFPPKPKKPQNAFLLYLNHVRSKFMQESPHTKLTDIVKRASQEWAELNPTEKESFQQQYNKNYEIYVQQLKEYNESVPDEQKQLEGRRSRHDNEERSIKRKKETLGKPKKPVSPFFSYVLSKKIEKDPSVPYKEWLKSMSEKWREMSNAEKEPYVVEVANSLMRYKKDMKDWENRMLSLGHDDIIRKSKDLREE